MTQNEWQPIESAPRDGTAFLGFEADGEWLMGVMIYSGQTFVREGDLGGYVTWPDYWQPLPPPPESNP